MLVVTNLYSPSVKVYQDRSPKHKRIKYISYKTYLNGTLVVMKPNSQRTMRTHSQIDF
jgi:hypothetical protein